MAIINIITTKASVEEEVAYGSFSVYLNAEKNTEPAIKKKLKALKYTRTSREAEPKTNWYIRKANIQVPINTPSG